ncbi:septal ring lytic transglycosylase RlpA family protein [Oleisolibacter albus]|uniref:septal ring lytic transglycosylase RlpA family protein n=1 Tax=Oleisolibacter albus TaxID=2171757 RepID=UPI000DF4352E|nr:septal ring lytic transglycosylase RlpA family protein [Oleisolibacter albus]
MPPKRPALARPFLLAQTLCFALSLAPPFAARADEPVAVDKGEASFYGNRFHGKKTASGEIFDKNKPTAASKDLPLGAKAEVTNLETGKSVEVKINDRGPHVDGRIIDLSEGAAKKVGLTKDDGVAPVVVEARPSDQPTADLKEKIEQEAREPGTGE